MRLRVRSYKTEQGLMVAVCDSNLLGETFKEGEIRIEVTESFYGGDKTTTEEAKTELDSAVIANLVGEKSVNLGIEIGLIDEENVLYVDGVPHAQMVRI